MGVNGLWEIVCSTKQTDSFTRYTTVSGFTRPNQMYPMLNIGVDVSIWIAACEAGARKGSLHSQTENAALKIFFFRLCRLLTIPANFIFVFDGPDRPSHKCGTKVIKHPAWVTAYLKPLIEAFGFHHHQAPAEAEAELAQLNQHCFIDAIITEDSDVLVFGGLTIIRCSPTSQDYDNINVYHTDNPPTTLTKGGLIMYALCAGGDYSDGIPMCGPETVFAVARLAFGDSLLTALETLSGAALTDFLAVWRQQVRHVLNTNPNKVLPRARPSLLDHITDTFPDLQVAELYRMPITTWSTSPEVTFNWLPRLPRPGVIANFCEARFGWDAVMVAAKFHTNLWPGLALRLFCFPLTQYQARSKCLSSPVVSTQILATHGVVPLRNHNLSMVKLRISTSSFVEYMGDRWLSAISARPLNVKVPHIIYEQLISESLDITSPARISSLSGDASGSGTWRNPIEVLDSEDEVAEYLIPHVDIDITSD
ncbi:hypothetical protein PLEOSDRAFT_1114240 [Pleurotus ostreatus PC15]|uniref:XPG-I domain-containing protein n=2 Tax=Pleurotus TaxID=5320 RepID=A0A067NKK7_PLEO1|nr:hypothetical protein CCMSSC00406_0009798 [Pleurotus cornucopiae]KDQ24126.1 hypothetical protein PLEOSDRAFT_1114240 [Pleurotus ostreatus PC15]